MGIKKLVEFLALFFVVVFVFYFVFSRGKMLVDVYHDESRAYGEDLAEHGKCESDHDYQHKAPMKCIRADLAVKRWWRWHAVHRVYEDTYLCIDYPCSSLLRGAFDSWTSLAVLTAFLVSVFLVVFGGIFSRIERGEKLFGRGVGRGDVAMRPRYSQMEYPNGPAVMEGYDDYDQPVQIVSHGGGGGVRQRFSAWLPGAQGRVRDLI